MGVGSSLHVLERFETTLAELYEWLTAAVAGDEAAAAVFFRMAMEERGHARMVAYVRRANRQNPAGGTVDEAVIVSVHDAIEKVRQFMGRGGATLDEAVAMSLEIENAAAECHLVEKLRSANPDMASLLGSLGSGDRVHVDRLMKLAAERGLN